MSRPNLLDELGTSYFRDRFTGSMLFLGDRPAIVETTDPSGVILSTYTGVVGRISEEKQTVSPNFFKDLSVFAAPPLGWRQAMQGRYLAFFSRNNRSYARAVSTQNLQIMNSPLTEYLLGSGDLSYSYYDKKSVKTMLAMKPEYTRFSEGVKELLAGNILSFAASPNIAVYPVSDTELCIMFNSVRVGTVLSNGNIECTIPSVNKLIKESL